MLKTNVDEKYVIKSTFLMFCVSKKTNADKSNLKNCHF